MDLIFLKKITAGRNYFLLFSNIYLVSLVYLKKFLVSMKNLWGIIKGLLKHHRIKILTGHFLSVIICMGSCKKEVIINYHSDSFRAYYTNVEETYEPLKALNDEFFGRYNDIVVNYDSDKKVVFSKLSSFLPVYKSGNTAISFKELVVRKGDGPDHRPDLLSKYSHARIIKNTGDSIIISWRYFPDYYTNPGFAGVVEEYFTFTRDFKVLRIIQVATSRIDDWNNDYNTIKHEYLLTESGINLVKEEVVDFSENREAPPTISPVSDGSILHYSFENIVSDYTANLSTGIYTEISGNKTLIKKGIKGKAIQLDGYFSGIEVDFNLNGVLNFTLEGFIALAAYPFGWAPLIQQSDWEDSGFYLGVNEEGFPGFHIKTKNEWLSIVMEKRLNLFEWYHLAATINYKTKEIALYINGEKVESSQFEGKLIPHDESVTIGLNKQKMPDIKGRIRSGKYPSLFGLDGLIDEVIMHPVSLTPSDLRKKYKDYALSEEIITSVDLKRRKFPRLPDEKKDKLYAEYTRLQYHESWDNMWRVNDHADIVVHLENSPAKIVFWRGTSYGPFYVTEKNKWIGDQSNEDYIEPDHPDEAEGCLEHMSDKQCRHSFVRIIENSPARVVIHWRYGLVDSRYLFSRKNDGYGTMTDEYWTIYPDGTAVRHVPRGIVFGDGWVETMFLSEPGTCPEDQVETEALTLMDLKGESVTFSWDNEIHTDEENVLPYEIAMVNSKSKLRMFNIYPAGSYVYLFGGHGRDSRFHWWNHWPVSQITSDGRGARADDRMAHSSLCHGAPADNYLMYGITDKNPEQLISLAKYWNNPPQIRIKSGISRVKFIQEENAYHMSGLKDDLSFTMIATENSPAVNPAFVLNDWYAGSLEVVKNDTLLINGKDYETGYRNTERGRNTILRIKFRSGERQSFIIKKL